MILDKNIFGYLSLFFVVLSGVPYIARVLKGKIRPHVFTWFLWGLITFIAAAGQHAAKAGPGAWGTTLGAVFSIVTFLLCFSHGDKSVTKIDWAALAVGLAALPLWQLTANPFWAVGLVTLIDAVGYIPTLRKSYAKPSEEMIFSYIAANMKHVAAILATVDYSLTTLIYPVLLFGMNSILVIMLIWRRHQLKSVST